MNVPSFIKKFGLGRAFLAPYRGHTLCLPSPSWPSPTESSCVKFLYREPVGNLASPTTLPTSGIVSTLLYWECLGTVKVSPPWTL